MLKILAKLFDINDEISITSLIGKSKTNVSDSIDNKQEHTKSERILVEQIHQEFREAGSATLAKLEKENKEIETRETKYEEMLISVGAVAHSKVKDHFECLSTLEVNKKKIEIINQYTQHYPQNNFIAESDVKYLCGKYNLVIGWIYDFIADIPESNLNEMERFICNHASNWREDDHAPRIYWLSTPTLNRNAKKYVSVREHHNKQPFKIVAPVSYFDMTGKEVVDRKIQMPAPDPIVLQPVEYGYLIVTAWGPEAADSLVVNSNKN